MQWKQFYSQNKFLIFTLFGIILGIITGISLKYFVIFKSTEQHDKQLFVQYLGFPGELMMRSFSLIMAPFLMTSVISGITNLGSNKSGKLVPMIFCYYLATTVLAICTAVLIALVFKPGKTSIKEQKNITSKIVSSKESIIQIQMLDLIRNLVPENFVGSMLYVDQTVVNPEFISKSGNLSNSKLNVFELTKVESTNVLGLVLISVCVGVLINNMETKQARNRVSIKGAQPSVE